jgi:superfamily II DNA or RNA helicase
MKIVFNAAEAQILEITSEEQTVVATLRQQLTFIDKSIFFANKNLPIYKQRNPNRCLLTKDYIFPTGLLPKVFNHLRTHNVIPTLENQIPVVNPVPAPLPDWAWTHQRDMVKACLLHRRGISKMPTGSGKTKAAGFLLQQFPKSRCLFTVPTKDLLHQSVTSLEEILSEPIGKVGDGICDWKRITVGIINSLSNQVAKNPNRFRDIEVLIMDECHRAGSNYYVTVGNACPNTDIRFGLSATPWRTNGDDLVMEGVLGPVVFSVTESVMINLGVTTAVEYNYLEIPDPEHLYTGAVKKFHSDGRAFYVYPTDDGKPDRKEVYEMTLVNNQIRNNLIIKTTDAFLKSDYPYPGVLLVERIEHGNILQTELKKLGYEIPFVHGEVKKRPEIFNRLGKDLKLMIASTILKEGVDIPQLGVGILAGGGSSSSKVIQQVGRICRTQQGKSKAIIIDFADQEKYYLSRAANARLEAIESIYPKSTHLIQPFDIPTLFLIDANS